jgi:hypothetical protein
MIKVRQLDPDHFSVSVGQKGFVSRFEVSLDDDYHHELCSGALTKAELIRRSFEFLLEREPKEAILSKFDLRVISRYFPDYTQAMRCL